jgi:hypothetical protein
MGRAVVGVIAGYLAIGALVAFTDMLFARLVPGWKQMVQPPMYYFAVTLGMDFLYSILGGYVCAMIATTHRRGATLGLIVLGSAIGVVAQALLWKTVPHWFGIGLLLLYPLAVWIGSRLGSERPVPAT